MWEIIPLNVQPVKVRAQAWTMRDAVEKRVSHTCQTGSGGSYYAVLTLRVEPYSGPEGRVFINAAPPDMEFVSDGDDAELRSYVEAVAEGVGDVLREKADAGRPVTNLLVVLAELKTHEVDSRRSAYRRAAQLAMEACLEDDNLDVAYPKEMMEADRGFQSKEGPKQPWIVLRYHPGFSYDLTSWETQIKRDGALSQIVNVSRHFSPRNEQRTDHFHAKLSAEQIAELCRLIEDTDFDAPVAVARNFCVDDWEWFTVTIHERGITTGFHSHFLQPLDAKSRFDLSSAWRLWSALDALSPYGFHSKRAIFALLSAQEKLCMGQTGMTTRRIGPMLQLHTDPPLFWEIDAFYFDDMSPAEAVEAVRACNPDTKHTLLTFTNEPDRLASAYADFGYRNGGETPLMRKILEASDTQPSKFHVRLATDQHDMARLNECGMRMTAEHLQNPQLSYYFVEDGGRVVCWGRAFYASSDMIYVSAVGTLPEYRRRGLATALMEAIHSEAAESGRRESVLCASEEAYKLYTRLGYETITTMVELVPSNT